MMKAGVVYPQTELGGDTGAVKAFAQAAEDLGYDHIVIYDHVLGADHAGREPKLSGPYKENDPFHEPFVTFAYLSGVTKNLGLTTGVIILPQRQTALFAKQAADVDLFSDGRLRLGVGVGWNWVEYDGFEMSRHFRRRGKRQEQQIALIRKLWEQPVVDHEDSDHRIERAGILPRPKRKIPIWLGGSARPRSTGQPGSRTDFCSPAGAKPRRSKSRRGSKPSLSSSEGMPMHSASNPSSNTVAGTTDGLAISRRGAVLGGATYLS
jgi:probable F420-dependent oxidoreductase